jgi:hypothetical protein
VDPTIRLRLATRIHFALLRQYSEDVAVNALLKGEHEGREALWVCEGSGQEELVTLARQFNSAVLELPVGAPTAAAPRDPVRPREVAGFAVAPPVSPLNSDAEAARPRSWLNPSRWIRPGTH